VAKNIDYSNSAVNLTNPDDVKNLLSERSIMASVMATYQEALKASNKELCDKIAELSNRMENNEIAIKTAIDLFGSYQDTATGFYGVKQRKVSVSYDPAKFKLRFPAYAPAIIIEAVDTVKLNGLIKGGLVTADEMKDAGIVTEKPSFVYIVRADIPAPAIEANK
jgi:hypothetical protein